MFLHGLESKLDDEGRPVGRKATFLRERFLAVTPSLDTGKAQQAAAQALEAQGSWRYPFDGYEEAFETPLARARAAITERTRLVVASSFGAAVMLRILHEAPTWTGAVIFLAGAGVKLTPHRTIPDGVRALLVHGRADEVVPVADSRLLAESSPEARLLLLDDGHRLRSAVNDEGLGAWVVEMLGDQDQGSAAPGS